jgi:hypothetical protein
MRIIHGLAKSIWLFGWTEPTPTCSSSWRVRVTDWQKRRDEMKQENLKEVKAVFDRLRAEDRNMGNTDLFIQWYRSAETSINEEIWPGGVWAEWIAWLKSGPDSAVLDGIWEALTAF